MGKATFRQARPVETLLGGGKGILTPGEQEDCVADE